jgi:predicted MPP superfamily phosphohydrolase
VKDLAAAVLLILLPLSGAGCGSDTPAPAESAARPPAAAAADTAQDPEDAYGVPAADNVSVLIAEVEVPDLPPGWNGLRLGVVSDLRLGAWTGNAAVAASVIRTLATGDTDVVVLLGNLATDEAGAAALPQLLAPLRGKPVLAVLGDADVQSDALRERITAALSAAGATVLNSARAPIARGGDTAFIAGVDPALALTPEWRQAETLAGLARGRRTPLLLSSQPRLAMRAPSGAFPLMIGGDTFCGDVSVPGAARLEELRAELNASASGNERVMRIRGGILLMSCAAGFSYIPARAGGSPEVMIVRLVPPPAQAATPAAG